MRYKVWVDGSSIDSNFGGWALHCINEDGETVTQSGHMFGATNNQAELICVEKVLQLPFLSSEDHITIATDSNYVINMLTKGFRAKQNIQLVSNLRKMLEGRNVSFEHTPGHGSDEANKFVDGLAYSEAVIARELGSEEQEIPTTELGFDSYQTRVHKTSLNTLINGDSLTYPILGLANEAGEVAGKVKKLYRDKGGVIDKEFIELIKDELGDVLWYVQEAATQLNISLYDIAMKNVNKLESRQSRSLIQGSGDNR